MNASLITFFLKRFMVCNEICFLYYNVHMRPLPRSPEKCNITTCTGNSGCSYPVSGQGLCSVLMNNPNVTWRLDPGFSIHLHRNSLFSKDCYLYCPALQGVTGQKSSKMLIFQKHKPFSVFPKPLPRCCSFGATWGTNTHLDSRIHLTLEQQGIPALSLD